MKKDCAKTHEQKVIFLMPSGEYSRSFGFDI